ncbi:MAG: HD domain-containing protein [Gammaproteobacteria bacterium]|nr:HD domain-containing protein [Gammaproteobacteria bacterium]MDH5693166.1 HD domain-containing protein [Gammaproteobacteria bacterium]
MTKRLIQVTKNLIKPDQPLFCPIYKEDGTLLVRKGYVLSHSQVSALNKHENLFTFAKDLRRSSPEYRKRSARKRDTYNQKRSTQSPFVRLQKMRDELIRIYEKPDDIHALDDILRTLERLEIVCEDAPDAALATIFVDPDDHYTVRHALHVGILCYMMAEQLNWDEAMTRSLVGAALTMNLSMGLAQDGLQAQAEPLTKEQKRMIHIHPIESARMLMKMGLKDKTWLNFIANHHENLDGSGYPRKLKMDDIPLGASMLHLADVYCAKVTGRRYREPILANVAAKEVFLDKDTKSQNNLIEVFIRILGIYPPGVMVRLNNGENAVVVKRGERVDTPSVRSLLETRGKIIMNTANRNTAKDEFAIQEVLFPNRLNQYTNFSALWGFTSK